MKFEIGQVIDKYPYTGTVLLTIRESSYVLTSPLNSEYFPISIVEVDKEELDRLYNEKDIRFDPVINRFRLMNISD